MKSAKCVYELSYAVILVFFAQLSMGQELASIEFSPQPDQSGLESMVVSFLPQTGFPLTDEDSKYAIQYRVSSIMPISGDWLLEKSEPLTKEEEFVKAWFLAYKDVSDLSKFDYVLSTASYMRAQEQYASGERPHSWEMEAFDPFSDVRLLGLARYGYIHLMITEMNRHDGLPHGQSTVLTILENEEYRQSMSVTPFDDATTGLSFGSTANIIIQELKQKLGVE